MTDKRSFNRYKIELDARCKPFDGPDEVYSPVTIVDLGPNGFTFISSETYQTGRDLCIKAFLHTNDIVSFHGNVVRSELLGDNKGYKISIKIISSSESDRNAFLRFYQLMKIRNK